jgi:uncharacterized protein (TIGR03437 family)
VKTPLVHFRTWKAETVFSGLLTGIAGLWAVDVKVPEVDGLEDGATPVTVTLEGRTSNTASVWVDW